MKRISAKASPTFYEYMFCEFINPQLINNVYDIGVGPKSEYDTIKSKFKNISFYGTEPNPDFFEMLRDKFPGKLLDYAISEEGGRSLVEFHLHPENIMASGIIPYDDARDAPRKSVKSITLDEFDSECGRQDGVLIWMDIEGYELKALKSGAALLSSGRVQLLNLEVRSSWNGKNGGCTEAEIDDYLSSFGYSKVFSYNHYRSSHHHDSIYASPGYVFPPFASTLREVYNDARRTVIAGIEEDLTLALVDLNISRMEAADKVAFLRDKLSKQ
ncbi:FkbM family methyltransferase [Rhizobium mongolense]|uniref:FkbM family methyltransferase n=1 Tax=Rhizobium mongolense TaxID=57676 RepID=UPI0035573E6E